MSNQPKNEIQQSSTLEEVRQSLLTELNASKQAIADLSDEELEAIVGGGKPGDAFSGVRAVYNIARAGGNNPFTSAGIAVVKGTTYGKKLGTQGIQGSQAMYDHGANHLWSGSPQGPKQ